MKTFILLATLSPQGLQTLRFTPERLLEVNREIEDLGGRVLQQWAVLGYYDFISVIEAPDEEAAGNMVAELSARGSATFDTLIVMDPDDLLG
ncbi:MAG: GYD domain-containing protein [Miltoncostaeaceae bacterium]